MRPTKPPTNLVGRYCFEFDEAGDTYLLPAVLKTAFRTMRAAIDSTSEEDGEALVKDFDEMFDRYKLDGDLTGYAFKDPLDIL